jgi:hypothetical protein
MCIFFLFFSFFVSISWFVDEWCNRSELPSNVFFRFVLVMPSL